MFRLLLKALRVRVDVNALRRGKIDRRIGRGAGYRAVRRLIR